MLSFAERRSAHEARINEINADAEKKIADARRAVAAAQTAHAATLAGAEADFADGNAAADEALAAETLPKMIEHVRAFPKNERGASSKLAELWRDVDARSLAEVGEEPSEHLIALAFCYAHSQGAAAKAAGQRALDAGVGSPGLLDAARKVHLTTLDGSGPAEVRGACAEMEVAVERFARGAAGTFLPDPDRLVAISRFITRGRYLSARARFDEEKAARDLANMPHVPNGGRIVT